MNLEQIRKEAPKGATHIDHIGRYWKLKDGLVFQNNTWIRDITGFSYIWKPLN
jgi:hypothetical protein